MRSGGKGVKILPRVLFEGWSVNDYMELFANERMMHEVAEFIMQFVDVSECTSVTNLIHVRNCISQLHVHLYIIYNNNKFLFLRYFLHWQGLIQVGEMGD